MNTFSAESAPALPSTSGTGIYSLLVGFFLSLICIVIVSLCTKAPNEEMQKEFADVADKSIEL